MRRRPTGIYAGCDDGLPGTCLQSCYKERPEEEEALLDNLSD